MIKKDDVLMQLSLDSAQLYCDKKLDCCIFMYIIYNLAPDLHNKKRMVIFTGFISGPEKMKDRDFFLYPIFYHIAMLQNKCLYI